MHRSLCPYTLGGTLSPVAERISALCSGSPPVRTSLRITIGLRIMRTAVNQNQVHNQTLNQPYNLSHNQTHIHSKSADPREFTRMNPPDDLLSARLWCRGFSARVRLARKSGNACKGIRATALVISTKAVRGKAAPRRMSGALLFGPFSCGETRKRAREKGNLENGGELNGKEK